MTNIFTLRRYNTLPKLRRQLLNPDGTVVDLTGSTSYWVLILLTTGVKLIRPATQVLTPAEGTIEYAWVATDWNAASSPDANGAFQIGGLILGVHLVDYDVLGPLGARLTYPNGLDHDALHITPEIGKAV